MPRNGDWMRQAQNSLDHYLPDVRGIRSRSRRPETLIGAVGIGLAVGAVTYMAARLMSSSNPPSDSAPGRTARRGPWFGDYTVSGRSVTINRRRKDLFAFWRDFQNLPAFMENIKKVELKDDKTSVWTIAAPLGREVDVETKIVEERDGELIAWRSVPGSDIDTEGRITFSDAPGRGTVVTAIVAYKPPMGELGRLIAKLFQREPEIQGRRELKRFKMLMETGEITTSNPQRQSA